MAGNLLDDVKKYFVSQTLTASIPSVVGSTLGFGRNLFIGREPSSPVNCITIYPTGGFAPDVSRSTETPTIQIRIRNSSYPTGYKIGNMIIKKFHENTDICASSRGKCFAVQSQSIHIGITDDATAHIFTTNFMFKNIRY